MKKLHFLALMLSILIISLPICFSAQMTYDANGNLQYSSYDGVNLYREYNALNQLKFVRNGTNSSAPILEEFIFHPIEERTWIKKTYNSSGNVTETTYYLSKEFVMVVNASGIYNYTFIYLDDKIVAQVNPDNSVYYLLGDLKGSTVVTTNGSGAVLENTSYTDFGNIISGGTKSKRGYENKEYDSLTKSLDFNFRRVNPAAPVWEQPDTVIQNIYDPQALNRYMFERGNSWKNVDPNGHWLMPAFLILGAVLSIASIGLIIYDMKTNPENSNARILDLTMSVVTSTTGIVVDAYGSGGVYGAVGGLIIAEAGLIWSGYQIASDLIKDAEQKKKKIDPSDPNQNQQQQNQPVNVAPSQNNNQETSILASTARYAASLISYLAEKTKQTLDSWNGGSAFGGGAGCSGTGCWGQGGSIDPDTGENHCDDGNCND